MKSLLRWLGRIDAGSTEKLRRTKTVKIEGIIFKIRQIDASDFLTPGWGRVHSSDLAALGDDPAKVSALAEQLRNHFAIVFTKAVMDPPLLNKLPEPGEPGLYLERLLDYWEITTPLYHEISRFALGRWNMRAVAAVTQSLRKKSATVEVTKDG